MAEKQEVVTLKAIAYELAEKHELPKKTAVEVLDGFVAALTKSLKKGAKTPASAPTKPSTGGYTWDGTKLVPNK